MVINLLQILFGATALSLLHALLPNHWLPLVAIGRAERWSLARTLALTLAAGSVHVLSTTGLGVLVGLGGLHMSEESEGLARWVGSGLLMLLGLLYFLRTSPVHVHSEPELKTGRRLSWGVLAALLASMFFSPCLEIEAFYLTAGAGGAPTITAVAITHLIVTLATMCALVALAWRGLAFASVNFIARYDRQLTGTVMIVLAIANLFIHF